MSYSRNIRANEAAFRRQEREAQRHQRELERRAKEQAKLSAIELARLEVETFENQIEMLLSVHKEVGKSWNWSVLKASLPPPCPLKKSYHELRAKQNSLVTPPWQVGDSNAIIEQSRLQDESIFRQEYQAYTDAHAQWNRLMELSTRILAEEEGAFSDALAEYGPLDEVSDSDTSIDLKIFYSKLLECRLKLDGKKMIPPEIKSLTANEKLVTKPMPKGRFFEIYQGWISSCVLRVARELFAFLPLDTVLVTVLIDTLDYSTGHPIELPVLSVSMPRVEINRLRYDQLNPYNAIENFPHRGTLSVSRRSEDFERIIPLTPADLVHEAIEGIDFVHLLTKVHQTTEEIKSKIGELTSFSSESNPQTTPSQ